MTRPPLRRTELIADLPPSALRLLASLGDLDLFFLPTLAGDVDVVVPELVDRILGDVRSVRIIAGRLLDHLAVERDLLRDLPRLRLHDPDALGRRPDQRVDLVQLPALMALAECRAVVEHNPQTVLRVVAAVEPAPEAGLQEPLRDVLVVLVVDPILPDEDAVLERARAEVGHLHDVEVALLVELARFRVLRLENLGELVVRHRGRRVDLSVEEEVHVERLLDDRRVLLGVDAVLVQRREELVLVSSEPDADLLALEVRDLVEATV